MGQLEIGNASKGEEVGRVGEETNTLVKIFPRYTQKSR